MGRGRAKAKQRKVARELKYRTYQPPDLDQLQRELSTKDEGDEQWAEGLADEADGFEDESNEEFDDRPGGDRVARGH